MENIRLAKKEDSRKIAEIMILATDEIIYNFIGKEDNEEAISFLEQLIKEENNQYSYTNTIVLEIDHKIVGSATFYDGGLLEELRRPALQLIKNKYNRILKPEDETEKNEIYIDTIAISKDYQGQGLGSKILDYLIEEIVHKQNQRLGLLVDQRKPSVKKLYQKKGFIVINQKTLMNIKHEHMQISNNQKR